MISIYMKFKSMKTISWEIYMQNNVQAAALALHNS